MTEEQKKRFKYWQTRTIFGSMVGYAFFYFVRKNMSIAMPAMLADPSLGLTKETLGIYLTLHGILYGTSRFVNGIWADRVNAHVFMAIGLLLSATLNLIFGCQTLAVALGLCWILNGWTQGMGFPPCAHLLAHWVPPKELATKMTIWNASHSIGASMAVIVCGYLVGMGWRYCFLVPGGIALMMAAGIYILLRDTPASVGLPPPEGTRLEGETEDKPLTGPEFRHALMEHVFKNPAIWLICAANFFVYIVRFGFLDWGPTMLKEYRGIAISKAGWMLAAFEISAVVGTIASGWFTDRFMKGRSTRTCVLCMAMTTLFLGVFWWTAATAPVWLATLLLMGGGFFIYGPQALVGVAVANLATKKVAATATGLTGITCYLSTIISGWGIGYIAQHYSWNYALGMLVGAAILSGLFFASTWRSKANGYAA